MSRTRRPRSLTCGSVSDFVSAVAPVSRARWSYAFGCALGPVTHEATQYQPTRVNLRRRIRRLAFTHNAQLAAPSG